MNPASSDSFDSIAFFLAADCLLLSGAPFEDEAREAAEHGRRPVC